MKHCNYVTTILCLLIMTLTARLMSSIVPFYFPQPSGHYSVGLKKYHWTDKARKETRGSDPLHPFRELMVLVWYPIQAQQKTTTLYHPHFLDFDKKNGNKITMVAQEIDRPICAHYQYHVPLVVDQKTFPLLIFSHGWGNVAELYTAYCTELASHGYVVASINHPYDCAMIEFPDGRRIVMPQEYDTMTESEYDNFLDTVIKTWIADTQFALQCIVQENNTLSSMFYQKLDCSRVGVLGHSFGGATAIRCSQLDDRFAAACNIDGDLYGVTPCDPFIKPCLFIEGKPTKKPHILHQIQYKQFQDKFGKNCVPGQESDTPYNYQVHVPQIPHASFTDRPILSHIKDSFLSSPKTVDDGFTLTKNINTIIRAFFDKHLKGIPCDELDWCSNKKNPIQTE